MMLIPSDLIQKWIDEACYLYPTDFCLQICHVQQQLDLFTEEEE